MKEEALVELRRELGVRKKGLSPVGCKWQNLSACCNPANRCYCMVDAYLEGSAPSQPEQMSLLGSEQADLDKSGRW